MADPVTDAGRDLKRRPCGWFPLPDGSVCRVEGDGRTSLVSREIDGECVWGQGFSAHDLDAHAVQILAVLAKMTADPSGFTRRSLWDANGCAVR